MAKTKPSAKKKSAKGLGLLAKTAQLAVARNEKKGKDALALIARKTESIAEAFYDIGLALQVLQRMEVYAALGARSFAEVVETRTRLSRTVAFELVKIPAHLSRETAVKLGSQQSIALIALTEATPEDDEAEAMARSDAEVLGVPISEQSVRGLKDAARKARPASGKKKDAEAAAAHSVAHALEARLEKVGKKDFVVVPLRKKDGWWVKLELPIDAAQRLSLGPARK